MVVVEGAGGGEELEEEGWLLLLLLLLLSRWGGGRGGGGLDCVQRYAWVGDLEAGCVWGGVAEEDEVAIGCRGG